MKALIFNSGIGNRMGSLTEDKPKSMITLYNGETIFERQIRILSECGIKEFIITTGPYEEQLINIASKYNLLKFIFVPNKDYDKTNYIVSMNNAYNYLNDDVLLLHGDLVFNKNLITKILMDKHTSLCLFNKDEPLAIKDFKGRFKNNYLQEVSINIFDNDCYAFQPLYKLDKTTIKKWKEKVKEYVEYGITSVYAENALNEIIHTLKIYGLSYKNHYIAEIDTLEDYTKVSNEIRFFDYKEQNIIVTKNIEKDLNSILNKRHSKNIFLVTGNTYRNYIATILKKLGYKYNIFSNFSSNPSYEEIKLGLIKFNEDNFDTIIALGGGSTIDVAKCIKLFSSLNNEFDFLQNKYNYNNINLMAIPTTSGTGSESTRFAVMYYNEEKKSITHDSILPCDVILDSNLLKTVNDYQKKSTLLDSLCQSIESFWSKGATTQSKDYAEKSIKLIKENYKGYLCNDEKALKNILIASNFSGKAINISKTTASHAMSYKLTSLYKISHGHAVALTLAPIWRLIYETGTKNTIDNLLVLAKIISYETVQESIEWFNCLFNNLNLERKVINEKDLDYLVSSVNIERLSNTPISINKKQIYHIYSLLSFTIY